MSLYPNMDFPHILLDFCCHHAIIARTPLHNNKRDHYYLLTEEILTAKVRFQQKYEWITY